MRYFCLVCDYDGTIAHDGRCAPSTVEALKRVRASGRKLILATGRQLPELQDVFPEHSIFDRIIAENGAILYRPESQACKALADPPDPEFVDELRRRGVHPLSVGQCIVATWHPHESTVLEVIRDLGLELQVIFNKDAVMVLPSGVNKATGLKLALKELFESPTCPDSLFSANNASTIWVIEALREMKIEMGIDVALVDSTTSTSIL